MGKCFNKSADGLYVKGNLDGLKKRLKKGMTLEGRIIENLGDNLYLLRIWGYNIVTQSDNAFRRFDEILIMVEETNPHLVLNLNLKNLIYRKNQNNSEINTNFYI